MTAMQRQRPNEYMATPEYRERLARKFLITLAVFGFLCLLMLIASAGRATSARRR